MTQKQKSEIELKSLQKRVKDAHYHLYGTDMKLVPETIDGCKGMIKRYYDNYDLIA